MLRTEPIENSKLDFVRIDVNVPPKLAAVSMSSMPVSGDTVVYQNWLMKRSQMTRLFRRRFTILTANGKLYSFRKVDLARAETLDLAQASLVWDIRGCTVEAASSKHTWILKPTGPNLKEEIYLRTCSALPSSSAHHWMRVMLAVARNNLHALYTDVAFLKVEILLDRLIALYVECEGSLYALDTVPKSSIRTYTYSGELPVRDSSPGSCIIVRQFAPDNESTFSQSDLIPRYRFHKSNTTFPWTKIKPQLLSMFNEAGAVIQSGTLRLSINEGLRDYAVPVMSRSADNLNETIDLALFKFQIKRLIRLIDRIGDFKDALLRVLEWHDPFMSWCWLVYATVVLLLCPGFVPSLLILHLVWGSLLRSFEFSAWWHASQARGFVGRFRTRFGYVKSNILIASAAHTPEPRTPPVSSTPPVTASIPQAANRLKTVMKEAAATALQSVSKSMATNSQITLKAEIWENQRRVIGGSQFHASNLSIFDRSRWSDETGSVALEAPSSRDWKIDVELKKTDENGWMYSFRWSSSEFHPNFSSFDFVRRRRWVPVAGSSIASPPLSIASPPASSQSPPFDLGESHFEITETEVPVVASLSGMVTSGPEYGNIQEDYDEANGQHQPKQTGITNIFHEFKTTANRAQFEIGNICEAVERYCALFSWRDELVSTVATAGLALIALVLIFVPLNVIIYLVLLSHFHLGFRRSKWHSVPVKCTLKQHVEPLLLTGNPNQLGGLDAHKLCLAINKRTGVNLSQKVLADLATREDLAAWICTQNPTFARVKKWMKRDWIENFIDHVPPDVCEEQQIFFPDANTYHSTPAPSARSVLGSFTPPEETTPEDVSLESSLISETL